MTTQNRIGAQQFPGGTAEIEEMRIALGVVWLPV